MLESEPEGEETNVWGAVSEADKDATDALGKQELFNLCTAFVGNQSAHGLRL